jgi:hypothetical protein
MKAEIKQKWLEALRSGNYKQGTGELCISYTSGRFEHCCLGVLAEVCGIDRSKLFNSDHLERIGHPEILGAWGLGHYNSGDPDTHTNEQRKLAAMNDTGKSFAEIADWIEANIPAESTSTGAT